MEKTRYLGLAPTPLEYNPSTWRQRVILSCIAFVAVCIATYMGLYQWKLIQTVWDPVFGMETARVLDSQLSHDITKIIAIPDSILGAVAYLADIFFALAGSTRRWMDRPWLVFLFGLEVIPLGVVSAVLVGCQAFVVGSYCFLCLVCASISVILIFFAYSEVRTSLLFLSLVYRKSKSFKVLWDTFWGRPSAISYEVACTIALPQKGAK